MTSLPSSGIRRLVLLACLAGYVLSCHRSDPSSAGTPSGSAAPCAANQTPIDRLLPGELGASAQLVFGFPVPNGMVVERAFPDAVHLVGDVTIPGLVDYIRKHAQVGPVELMGSTMRFDKVRIPARGTAQQYRFEVAQHGSRVRLLVKGTTPPPTQPGLSEEDRWRQAGLKPDGQPLNMAELR